MNKKNNENKEVKCPLCNVSDEIIKILKEKSQEKKLKKKLKDNDESRNK